MTYKTEDELIEIVRAECGSSNWRLGEQAALWTERWGKGKTDADFCERVGGESFALTPDRVGRCRRVWIDFGKVFGQYRGLKWSHFDKVRQVDPENQIEALIWAEENEATVSEMMAWARMQWGECELRLETSDEGGEPEGEVVAVKPAGQEPSAISHQPERSQPEDEEEDGVTEDDHPMSLIRDEVVDTEQQPSAGSSTPTGERAVVANLIRCLRLEEQTLRKLWPSMTDEERQSVSAVVELMMGILMA